MQQIAVIQEGKVFATHTDDQGISFVQYPNADKIVLLKPGACVNVRDDEPTTDRIVTSQVNIPAVSTEITRLRTIFESIETTGILELDNKGTAEVSHGLGSKWYAVSITPLDGAMPNIHVVCKKNEVTVKGGAKNGKITYLLTLIQPPKGRENQLLTDPY